MLFTFAPLHHLGLGRLAMTRLCDDVGAMLCWTITPLLSHQRATTFFLHMRCLKKMATGLPCYGIRIEPRSSLTLWRNVAMTMTRWYDSAKAMVRWCNDDGAMVQWCVGTMAIKRCSIALSLACHRTIVIALSRNRLFFTCTIFKERATGLVCIL